MAATKLFEICKAGDGPAAERLVRHYSVTALSLIVVITPEHEPTAVRTALRIVMRAPDPEDRPRKTPGGVRQAS